MTVILFPSEIYHLRKGEEDIMFLEGNPNKLESLSSSAISQSQFNSDSTVQKSSVTSNCKIDF